jgi:hypothetical protein
MGQVQRTPRLGGQRKVRWNVPVSPAVEQARVESPSAARIKFIFQPQSDAVRMRSFLR